jgi:hypothetical protein
VVKSPLSMAEEDAEKAKSNKRSGFVKGKF